MLFFLPSQRGRWIRRLRRRRKRDYRQPGGIAFPLRGRWHEVPDEVFLRIPPKNPPPFDKPAFYALFLNSFALILMLCSMGFHSTFIKIAATEMGIYVNMKSGKVNA